MSPENHPKVFDLENLSDEVQLKIFSYLSVKDLIHCSHVSSRTRRICQDESLWLKVNLCGKIVPADFIKYILDNGCKYINLSFANVIGELKLFGNIYNVKYLNLSDSTSNTNAFEELIASCQFLQKLSLSNLSISSTPNIINNIKTQNLHTLDLSHLYGLNLDNLNHLLKSDHLKAISFRGNSILYNKRLCNYVMNNLPSKLMKISLASPTGMCKLTNYQIETLTKKCKNLIELELTYCRSVSDIALESVIENLCHLEKLDVSGTKITLNDFTARYLDIRSMPKLEVLKCQSLSDEDSEQGYYIY